MPTKRETSSSVRLRSVKPNAGLRDAYAKKLRALIREMSEDVAQAVKSAYEDSEPLIAQDAKLPARKLNDLMGDLRKRWQARFDNRADELSKWFAGRIKKGVSNQQKSAHATTDLPKAFTLGFDKGRVTQDVFEGIVAENASLIKSISRTYLDQVEGLVMRSVTSGRDIVGLAKDLQKRYDITKRRADFIARDQNNKATEAVARANDLNLGFTEAEWIHIPGKYTSRHSHKQMDGKKFDLSKGMYDEEVKRHVLPGELPGCQCTYKPIYSPDIWKRRK